MDESTQILKDQIASLPQELQRYLVAGSWTQAVDSIARNFTLEAEQAESLKRETLIVLAGIENVSSLKENIQKALLIAPNDAARIAKLIEEQAIAPVRNALEPLQDAVSAEQQTPASNQQNTTASQPAAQARPIGMLDDKLSSVIKLPSEETHYAEADMKPEPPAQTPTEQQTVQTPPSPPEQAKPNYGPGQDPYREPPV